MARTLTGPPAASQLDVVELHRRACECTRGFVAGIEPGRWGNACNSEGDVRGLVNHLVAGQRLAVELLQGRTAAEAGVGLQGDLLGDDPLAAYDAACALAQAAWEEPGALERTCSMDDGGHPATVYASMRVMDVFVHGWDLAIATGRNAQLDQRLADVIYREWKPREPMLRQSGLFGPPPEVAPNADLQTKLLALFGRAAAPCDAIRARELGHVGMYVRDLEASVHFYRDLLGFGESGRLPGTVFLTTGRSHHELALIQPGPEAVASPHQPAFGVNHIAIRVGDGAEDLRKAHRRLKEAGVPILEMCDFVIQQSIQLEDPDGIVVELYVDTDAPWRTDPHIFEKAVPTPLQL